MLNLEKLVAYFSKKGADPEEIREVGKLVNKQFPEATGVIEEIAPSNLIFFKARGYIYYVRIGELVICYAAKKNKGNAEFLYNPHTGVVDFSTRLHSNHILWKKRASKADKKRAKKYGRTREVVVDELLEAVKGGPLLTNRSSVAPSDLPSSDPPKANLDLDIEPTKAVKIETKEDLTKFQSSRKKPKKKASPRKKKPKPKSATRSAF